MITILTDLFSEPLPLYQQNHASSSILKYLTPPLPASSIYAAPASAASNPMTRSHCGLTAQMGMSA